MELHISESVRLHNLSSNDALPTGRILPGVKVACVANGFAEGIRNIWVEAFHAHSSIYVVSLRRLLLIESFTVLRFIRSFLLESAFPTLVKIKKLFKGFL